MFQAFIEEVTQAKDKITLKVKVIDATNTLYKNYSYVHAVDINTRFTEDVTSLLAKLNDTVGTEESEETLNELKQSQN